MRSIRSRAVLASLGLVVSGVALLGGVPAAGATTAARSTLQGSLTPASERATRVGTIPATARVSFDLLLALRNASGARALVRQVSDPASTQFHHYLTDAQWARRFGPAKAEVTAAQSWLRQHGFHAGALPKTGLFVPATGTVAQVEKAFSTTLGYYEVNGHRVRLANSTLSIPSSIAGDVTGAVGVNEFVATTSLSSGSSRTVAASGPNQEPPPPAGFRNPQPCSSYWGALRDTKDNTSLYAPFTSNDYDICGYRPGTLRAAYGATGPDNGSGVGIAIVDAYDSPTLFSDAQKYFTKEDASHPLSSTQFFNDEPATVDDEALCGGSGWFNEQALDVEATHAMAPGAALLFVGAQDCTDNALLAALQTAVSSGASVVTDSWGDTAGDLFTDAATKTAFDNTFELAASTGVSVLFSSGDSGDNFADTGLAVPNYPASDPFVTSVGGTTLEMGASGNRLAEYGWSTAKQTLCAGVSTTNCGSATSPAGSLAWQAGGGGGTSYYYTQPFYQSGVVPTALALRNEAVFGPTPLRVEPDIAMDADAQSGMLIGVTQTFPTGVAYGQFKEGGTSLASPLLAGEIADADQAAPESLGFLNPVLYTAYRQHPKAFNDIVAPATPDAADVIRVDYTNTVDSSAGYNISLRTINYTGPETYCDGTGNCATRNVTLTAAPGFDSLTGLGSPGATFIGVLKGY